MVTLAYHVGPVVRSVNWDHIINYLKKNDWFPRAMGVEPCLWRQTKYCIPWIKKGTRGLSGESIVWVIEKSFAQEDFHRAICSLSIHEKLSMGDILMKLSDENGVINE
jgi:hypothetical protein